jgi:hypothetical protein
LRAYPLIRERVEVTRGHETVGLIWGRPQVRIDNDIFRDTIFSKDHFNLRFKEIRNRGGKTYSK